MKTAAAAEPPLLPMASLFLGTGPEAECLAVEVVPYGYQRIRPRPWRGRVVRGRRGSDGDSPPRKARRGRVVADGWRLIAAPPGGAKLAVDGCRRVFGVIDSRIAERERSIDGSRVGRGLIRVFRCWVRPGGTNAAADVAGGRIAAGRRRRTDKHKNTELRRGLHAWDGLGRPKGVGHESSPAVGRKTAAVACGRKARSLRRNGGAACSEGPGPREGPGAKAPCAQQSTRTAHSLKLAQSAAALLTHNRYCSSDPRGGATIYLRLC